MELARRNLLIIDQLPENRKLNLIYEIITQLEWLQQPAVRDGNIKVFKSLASLEVQRHLFLKKKNTFRIYRLRVCSFPHPSATLQDFF